MGIKKSCTLLHQIRSDFQIYFTTSNTLELLGFSATKYIIILFIWTDIPNIAQLYSRRINLFTFESVTPSTQVLVCGLFCGLGNSYRPCGIFAPISWPNIGVWSSHRSDMARLRLGGTDERYRLSNHQPWSLCTLQQKVGICNQPCTYHLLLPMMRHPILNHKATLASVEMFQHSSLGISLWEYHPQGIWYINS